MGGAFGRRGEKLKERKRKRDVRGGSESDIIGRGGWEGGRREAIRGRGEEAGGGGGGGVHDTAAVNCGC